MLALVLALLSPAQAAPGFIPVQGYLTDSAGTAIDGSVDVTFRLTSDASGTAALWQDTLTLDVVNGTFAAELGSSLALDLDTFASYPTVHLGITVAGDSEMPLVPFDHVPYAAWAENTGLLNGVSLAAIRAEIPASSDIQAEARAVSFDSESELTALLDDNYTYSGGTGITVTGTTIDLDQATVEGYAAGVCYDTESELTTLLDDNYTYTSGTGISISNNQITVDQTTIEGWANGVDTNTTYSNGTGLNLTGTVFSVDQTTVEGWANGVDTDTIYSNGTGLNLTGTQFSVNQSTIEGWASDAATKRFETFGLSDGRVTATGTWTTNHAGWGENRFAPGDSGYTTACNSPDDDCSDDYLDLTLDSNTAVSVLMAHLDWSSTGSFEVWMSYDGGGTFVLHKTVGTYTSNTPVAGTRTSAIRTLVTNLPQGSDVVVRVIAVRGRLHFEGFGLSQEVMVEPIRRTTGWNTPALQNGWVTYSATFNPPGYMKDANGIVHLRGMIRSGTSSTLFTLPPGYRPAYRQLFATETNPNVNARVDVYANGAVTSSGYDSGWLSLDGLTFEATQ